MYIQRQTRSTKSCSKSTIRRWASEAGTICEDGSKLEAGMADLYGPDGDSR